MSTPLSPRETPAKRSLVTPVMARRGVRTLTARRGADASFGRARAAHYLDDHARLVAACGRRGYELLTPIGHGGMGRVWLARGPTSAVAIKAMLAKVADDPEFRAMFLDEGRIASRIASRHVARVFAMHEDDGVLFQVMEWIDGESLFELHRAADKRGQRVPLAVVLRALAGACDGLHAAHELRDDAGSLLNVVHRDVSPANVLLSASGGVKLVDFGIAKARARIAESTLGFALKGRVHYVAPEYARGQSLDRRSDAWSMGATLYFLLCGRAPYAASNDTASLFKLTSGEPLPPLPESIPRDVAAIAYRALERDPDRRFATAAEMRDALDEAATRIDPSPAAVCIARFVAEHESAEALERRRIVSGIGGPERETERAPRAARAWARLGLRGSIGAAVIVLALAVVLGVASSAGGVEVAARTPRVLAERAPRSLDAREVDVLVARPASRPRAPPSAPIMLELPATVDAHPPVIASAPAQPPPRTPARRHYGF